MENERVLPLSCNPLFTPVPVREGYLPLKDCVLSVSQFTGAERESLVELAKHLGAKYVAHIFTYNKHFPHVKGERNLLEELSRFLSIS